MHLPPRIRALRPTPALWYSTPQPPPPCVSPLRGRDHTSLCAHPLIVCNFSQHVFPPLPPPPQNRSILNVYALFVCIPLGSCVTIHHNDVLSSVITRPSNRVITPSVCSSGKRMRILSPTPNIVSQPLPVCIPLCTCALNPRSYLSLRG